MDFLVFSLPEENIFKGGKFSGLANFLRDSPCILDKIHQITLLNLCIRF